MCEQEQRPAGPSLEDVAFARVCLTRRRVTRAQVEECLEEQRRRAAGGEAPTLAQVMFGRGLVTAEQYARVLEQLRAARPGEAPDGHGAVPGLPLSELGPGELAARAPAVSPSGRYRAAPTAPQGLEAARPAAEPAPPAVADAELTVTMNSRQVLALPPERADSDYEVVDDEPHAPKVDAAIRRVLGVPEGTTEFTFGTYHVLELLAAGGMGAVYRARSTETGRLVALKALLEADRVSDHQLRRFVLEAQSATALVHPSIISVHDIGVVEGIPYFAMELVEGEDLQAHITRRTFERPALLELLATVADAVHHAHECGVIHRDLKPANVIVREHDHMPILTDFGLAKTRDQVGISDGKSVIGTPLFLSPEQVRGEEAGPCSDVYALGVMLYMALTGGRLPLLAKDREALYAKILHDVPAPPSQHEPGVGPDLDAVCLRALAKRREDRHPSAAALAEDLRRVARGEPRPSPAVAAVDAPAPTTPLRAPSPAPLPAGGGRGAWLALIAAALALGLAAVVVWAVLR